MMNMLPLGKLRPELLARLLKEVPVYDQRLIVGPGIGLDCAVVALEETCLVFKSDPITFVTDEIGWYAVQVNANDIATTGATPRWFLATVLLPEGKATSEDAEKISRQLYKACASLEISVIGGHTEITYGIDRPIIAGTMIGEVPSQDLITPQGASPGDHILLTKGVPIEGTAILAREFSRQLAERCTLEELQQARGYLYDPGISVVRDARLAIQAGKVSAMHDPTEGGLAGALWELAEACGHRLVINPEAVYIPALARKICGYFRINPLETIASGALLLTAPAEDAIGICDSLKGVGVNCAVIGIVESGPVQVLQSTRDERAPLPRPERDEIARIFEG
jgi:hydrogenase expression/formation protein HypE